MVVIYEFQLLCSAYLIAYAHSARPYCKAVCRVMGFCWHVLLVFGGFWGGLLGLGGSWEEPWVALGGACGDPRAAKGVKGDQKSIGVVTFRHPEGPQGPPGAPREALGGLGGGLGGPLGGLGGHFGGPRGPFRGNFWRTGGLAKSLVLLYKWLHLGCPRGPGGTSREAR